LSWMSKESPLLLKIGDKWVNVSTWKHSHPGGAAAIERLRNADCTDVFYSLHSPEPIAQVERMKAVSPPAGYDATKDLSIPNKTSLSFRAFREELIREGWFQRNWAWDAFYIGVMLSLCVAGTVIKDNHPYYAIFLIGLGMQQAGWIGHDYVHGRGKLSYYLGRLIGGLINGFSSLWWSAKHNKHHVHTNQVGIDDDIANDPVLHLLFPSPENDVWFRKYQHYYFHLAYVFLYASWRIQSAQHAWAVGAQLELLFIMMNAVWLLYLGPFVAIGSILCGGWFVAEVVTATHQSEEMIEGISYQFAEDQFRTTRDVAVDSSIGNWFWGGMQWQLEHHLFPTMPKYYYCAVSKKLKAWAEQNNIEYRASGIMDILCMNYRTMRKFAHTSLAEFQAAQQTAV